MADQVNAAPDVRDAREERAEMDERRIARAVAIGLPLVTLTLTLVVGVVLGAAMAILVLAAGGLLGVIALFWASLRVLSGDAPLPPELEALDASAHAVDALASRKKMLLRALKDLDVEHDIGKLDDDDRDQIANQYRAELKEVLRRIDESLAPHRGKAEEAARAYLARVGRAAGSYRGAQPEDMVEKDVPSEPAAKKTEAAPERVACAKCATKNDADAAFCKKCGAALASSAAAGAVDPEPATKETTDEA